MPAQICVSNFQPGVYRLIGSPLFEPSEPQEDRGCDMRRNLTRSPLLDRRSSGPCCWSECRGRGRVGPLGSRGSDDGARGDGARQAHEAAQPHVRRPHRGSAALLPRQGKALPQREGAASEVVGHASTSSHPVLVAESHAVPAPPRPRLACLGRSAEACWRGAPRCRRAPRRQPNIARARSNA